MKVGDYIHWRYSNYLNNGLTVDKGGGADPNSIFAKQREMLRANLHSAKHDEATRAQLEQQINFFFDPTPMNITTGFTAEQIQKVQQYLDNMVNQTVQQLRPRALGRGSWNRNDLSTTTTGGGSITLDDGSTETWSKIRKASNFTGKSRSTWYAIDRRVQQLIAQRDNLAKMAASDRSGVDNAFMERVRNFADQYKDFIAQARSEVEGELAAGTYVSGDQIAGIRSAKTDVNTSFANELQSLIDMTVAVTDTELKGIIGEVVPVVSQWAWQNFQGKSFGEIESMLQGLDQDVTIDLFTKKAGIGQQTSKKITMASKVISTNGVSGNSQVQLGGASLNTSYTQDKVDIALDVDGGKTINASVKNVNLASGYNIGLLSGANIVNFVQDYPTFANHYLNVTGNIGRGDRAPGSTVRAAHDALKFTIAVHAFSGGLWAEDKSGNVGKTAMAELFIVNDSSSNAHYRVYYIADLLDKVDKNLDYIKADFPMTHNNDWIGSHVPEMDKAWARVARMLGELRATKLKVSLDPAVLKT